MGKIDFEILVIFDKKKMWFFGLGKHNFAVLAENTIFVILTKKLNFRIFVILMKNMTFSFMKFCDFDEKMWFCSFSGKIRFYSFDWKTRFCGIDRKHDFSVLAKNAILRLCRKIAILQFWWKYNFNGKTQFCGFDGENIILTENCDFAVLAG